eukprot:scaffold199825_cov18-Prasinocladus_malaysianus.AAC.1
MLGRSARGKQNCVRCTSARVASLYKHQYMQCLTAGRCDDASVAWSSDVCELWSEGAADCSKT